MRNMKANQGPKIPMILSLCKKKTLNRSKESDELILGLLKLTKSKFGTFQSDFECF